MITPRAWSRDDRTFAAAVAAMLLPIVVAVIRAVARGWEPIGDNAYFLVRSRDVLTEHHPLLGTWTSASRSAGTDFNNPGPLLFDLLALPAKLGGGAGMAVGVGLLNAGSALGIALVARRRAGPAVGTAAALVTTLLCFGLGSELLFDPWQPHSLLLPFLFGLVLAWSVAAGDLVALPWALGVGSLVVQTHLSYTLLLAAVGTSSLVGLGLTLRRERIEVPEGWAARRRSLGRVLLVSAIVVALAWTQPVVEAFTGDGRANLARVADGAGSSDTTVGVSLGARLVADVVVVPPFWLRPSFAEFLLVDPVAPAGQEQVGDLALPALPAAVLLALLGGAMVALAVAAGRRDDRATATLLATAVVALGGAWATAAGLPVGGFGIVPHHFRWLWPVGAFVTFAVGAGVLCRFGEAGRTRAAVPVLALMTALVAVATLPTTNARTGPSRDEWAIDVMARARPQMGAIDSRTPLLVESSGAFNDPYSGPVLAELQSRGIPFGFTDEGMVRQFGPDRRIQGSAPRLLIRQGSQTETTPPGARRVVYVPGLSEAEQREMRALADDLASFVEDRGVPLTDEGRALLERPGYATLRTTISDGDAVRVLAEALPFLVPYDLVDLPEPWAATATRYVELRERWEQRTLALFLVPPAGEEG